MASGRRLVEADVGYVVGFEFLFGLTFFSVEDRLRPVQDRLLAVVQIYSYYRAAHIGTGRGDADLEHDFVCCKPSPLIVARKN